MAGAGGGVANGGVLGGGVRGLAALWMYPISVLSLIL